MLELIIKLQNNFINEENGKKAKLIQSSIIKLIRIEKNEPLHFWKTYL